MHCIKIIFLLSFFAINQCEIAEDKTTTTIIKNVTANVTATTQNIVQSNANLKLDVVDVSSSDETNDTVSWNTFFDTLVGVSLEQISNIQNNFKTYYNLKQSDIDSIATTFNATDYEYEYLLQHQLKKIIKDNKFNSSEDFMLDFVDLSNSEIEKIVYFNLNKVNGTLNIQTKWNQQTLREIMFRQQIKSSGTIVDLIMCNLVSVCKERENYSEYVSEWLRFILSEKDKKLAQLYKALPNILNEYVNDIKSSPQLKKNLNLFIQSDARAQRDSIDFVDETITNENVLQTIPETWKKSATLFLELFRAIDDAYFMTDGDSDDLDTITQMFANWSRTGSAKIINILHSIVRNMIDNKKQWPENKRSKVSSIWAQIIYL